MSFGKPGVPVPAILLAGLEDVALAVLPTGVGSTYPTGGAKSTSISVSMTQTADISFEEPWALTSRTAIS